MKTRSLLKKLHRDKTEFATADAMKKHCNNFDINYENALRHFLSKGYLIRIFKGIFYVKSPEEIELGSLNYSIYELVAKGLELKGVKDWYFGLHTALKLNNMTHEHFAVDAVLNDKMYRPKPIDIAGHKFKFVKTKKKLLGFGVTKNGLLKYSDPGKTILDFIYLWRYRGLPEEKIVMDLTGWAECVSMDEIEKYAKSYPKSVLPTLEKVVG